MSLPVRPLMLAVATLVMDATAGVGVAVTASRVRAQIDAPTGEVTVDFGPAGEAPRTRLRLAAVRIDGRELPAEKPSADRSGSASEAAAMRITLEPVSDVAAAVTWTSVDGLVHDLELSIEDNSAYYGCGERFGSLNHKGLILPIASIDRPEDKGSVSYKPVPYYMSTRGYAAWVDSAAPGAFDFNATDRDRVWLRFRAARLRLVLIDGPDFASMLGEFTRLTGRPRVPPAWAFAPWKSRNVHRHRRDVLDDAELTRKHDLPGSVIVIDSPWGTGYNDFVLNERQFNEPKSMFARLRELGFHTCLWLTPFINVENLQDADGIVAGPTSNYAEAERLGFLVKAADGRPMVAEWWKGRGSLVDFTNPAAVAWWHGQMDRMRPWGVRALKCDDGEGNFVRDSVFHDGAPAADMRNRYALLYLQAAQQWIDRRLGGDGVLLGRCGFTGSQQYPFCWAGDNEASFSFENGLPSVVLAGQNAALSGLSLWGHDIAGYMGTPSKELFCRWTQFGALSPVMQVHMTSNLGPWDFDDETLAIYRRFARLHTGLYPYIRSAAQESAERGMPIIRPMVLAFQGDVEAASQRYQYMFGPDLLVAPMIQPGTRRAVYLPKLPDGGVWIDYWTGREEPGGRTIEVEAPLDRMPLMVRGGAMICMLPDDVDTLITRHDGLSRDVVAIDERRVLEIWPGVPRRRVADEDWSAELQRSPDRVSLRLHSRSPRTIEVRRMHVTQADDVWKRHAAVEAVTRTVRLDGQPAALEWSWR